MNLTGFTNVAGDIRKNNPSNTPIERSESFTPKSESFNSMLEKAVDVNTAPQKEENHQYQNENRDAKNEIRDDSGNKTDIEKFATNKKEPADRAPEKSVKKAESAADENKIERNDALKTDAVQIHAASASFANTVLNHAAHRNQKKIEEPALAVKSDAPAKKALPVNVKPMASNIALSVKNFVNNLPKNDIDHAQNEASQPKSALKKAALDMKKSILPIEQKASRQEITEKPLADKIAEALKNLTSGAKSRHAAVSSDAKTAAPDRPGIDNTAKDTPVSSAKEIFTSTTVIKESGDNGQSSLFKNFGSQTFETGSAVKGSPAQQIANPFADKLDEIISQAKVTVRDAKNAQISIRLNPENLGKMNVSFGLENGVLHAKFLVDSPEVKESLLSNFSTLKDALANEGISVGAFQVDVRGDGNFKAHDNADKQTIHYAKVMAEKAETEYQAGQSATHTGAINLIA
jgi:flagellar hook-length control protein FliK